MNVNVLSVSGLQWSVPSKVDQERTTGDLATRLLMWVQERSLDHVVRSNRRDTVAQIAEKLYGGSDRKVSEHCALQFIVYGTA